MGLYCIWRIIDRDCPVKQWFSPAELLSAKDHVSDCIRGWNPLLLSNDPA